MNTKSEAILAAETAVEDAQNLLDMAIEKDSKKSTKNTKDAVATCEANLAKARDDLEALMGETEKQEPLLDVEKQAQAVEMIRSDVRRREEKETIALANKPVVERVKPLPSTHFGMAQHAYSTYDAKVPHGTPVEHLEDEDFWMNIRGRDLSVGDEIRVVPDDCAYYATLLVVRAIGRRVKTKIIFYKELTPEAAQNVLSGRFTVQVRGRLKHCVIDTATGKIVRDNIESLTEANNEALDMAKALSM